MNHRVQACIRGCLTLKLLASWNTVIWSLSPWSFRVASDDGSSALCSPSALAAPLALPSAGEMGMVSKGTGESGFVAPLVEFGTCRAGAAVAMSEPDQGYETIVVKDVGGGVCVAVGILRLRPRKRARSSRGEASGLGGLGRT